MGILDIFEERRKAQPDRFLAVFGNEESEDDDANDDSPMGVFINAMRENKTAGSDLSALYTGEEIIDLIRKGLEEGLRDCQCFICKRIINPAYKLIPDKPRTPKIIGKATWCRKHRKVVSDIFGFKVRY